MAYSIYLRKYDVFDNGTAHHGPIELDASIYENTNIHISKLVFSETPQIYPLSRACAGNLINLFLHLRSPELAGNNKFRAPWCPTYTVCLTCKVYL